MNKNLIVFILFMICFSSISSQDKNTYNFEILDLNTKEPVSYATILLKNLNRGTHADYDGFVSLPNLIDIDESIIISAIGYTSKELKLSEFKKGAVITIYLSTSIYNLKGIVIKTNQKENQKQRTLGAKEVVEKAVENISKNYPVQPYSYISYYRDYLQPTNKVYGLLINKKNINYINLNEAILEIFDAGFDNNPISYPKNQAVLYKYNLNDKYHIDKTLFLPYDNSSQKYSRNITIPPFGGNELNILNVTNPIRNYKSQSVSFINSFDKDFVKNHRFNIESIIKNKDVNLYKISFRTTSSRKTKRFTGKGVLYISKEDYSIYKINYSLLTRNNDKPKYNLSIEYKPFDDKMYLDYISFNNILEIKKTNQAKLNYRGFMPKDSTFIFAFSKPIEYSSIKSWKRQFKLFHNQSRLKISNVEIKKLKLNKSIDTVLVVSIDKQQMNTLLGKYNNPKDLTQGLMVKLKKVRDKNGFLIDDVITCEFYQFREIFVQKIFSDKILPTNSNYINKLEPLYKAKLTPINFKNDFWITTPLRNIKK